MKFNYRLLKKVRKEKLGLSRESFCFNANKEAGNHFLSIAMLTRLEEGKESNLSPKQMAYIYAVTDKDPNFFYGIEDKKPKKGASKT